MHSSKAVLVEHGLQPLPPPDSECSICHEELQAPSSSFNLSKDMAGTHVAIKVVSCGHVYGAQCLNTWLKTANTCPMCRRVLFPQEDYSAAQSYLLTYGLLATPAQDAHLLLEATVQHIRTQRQVFEARERVREQLAQVARQLSGDNEAVPAHSVSENYEQSSSADSANDIPPETMQLLRDQQTIQYNILRSTLEIIHRVRESRDEQRGAITDTENNSDETSGDQMVAGTDPEGNIDSTTGDRLGSGEEIESNIDSTQGQMGSVVDEQHRGLAIGYSNTVDHESDLNGLIDSHFSIVANDGRTLDFQESGAGGDDEEGWVDDNESTT
jgi:hypothetical protein